MAAETKSNVVDITQRLQKKLKEQREQNKKEKGAQKATQNSRPVQVPVDAKNILDMSARRKEMINTERRNVRRTVLSQFIGAFIVHPTKGLESVAVYDVSDGGLSFDLPLESGRFNNGETVSMRIYLAHDLYFPFTAKVTNVRPSDGANRHGVVFEAGQPASETLTHFVKFLECVATVARRDSGDRLVGRAD